MSVVWLTTKVVSAQAATEKKLTKNQPWKKSFVKARQF
jgi:hypothetical protein